MHTAHTIGTIPTPPPLKAIYKCLAHSVEFIQRIKMAQATVDWENKQREIRDMPRLPQTLKMGGTETLKEDGTNIECFKGWRDVLSNFYPCRFDYKGKTFYCVEQAYQFEKAIMYGREDIAAQIMELSSGFDIWLCAKRVMVDDRWVQIRVDTMKKILTSKLFHCEEYRKKLLSCNGIIVEAVPGDTFWSSGLSKEKVLTTPQKEWPGQNVMGSLHMELRDEMKKQKKPQPKRRRVALKDADESMPKRLPKPEELPESDAETKAAVEGLEKSLKDSQQSTTPPSSQGRCIWCLSTKPLVANKKFCELCASQGRECAHCHRPMPDRFFVLSARLCNACHRKHEKQKANRKQARAEKRKASNCCRVESCPTVET